MTKKLKVIKKFLLISITVITILILESNYTKSLSIEIPLENNSEVEAEPIFNLYKQDGETFEPIEGTKFIITDLEGKNVIGTDGKIVGNLENIGGKDYYVLTTDKNGYIKANLPQGLYKAIEIYANEAYILEENEENRTYYFEIGLQDFNMSEWIKSIKGYSWNYIKSTTVNKNGGIVAVGSISEYLPEIAEDFYNGVDLNSDGVIDEVPEGNNDGIIISYDEDGNYLWSETFRGSDDDCCNEIIQTSDGGYVVVGYTSSASIYLNGEIITDLSKSNFDLKNKDGFMLKINQDGHYEWGIRIGGLLDDEIIKVIETTTGDIDIIGNFYSSTFNFYENNLAHNIIESLKNTGEVNSFIASYSIQGKYNWSKKIGGNDYTKICDITEIEDGLVIALNYKGTIDITENNSVSSNLPDYQDGLIINYSLSGDFKWSYRIYSAPTNIYSDNKFIRITSIATTKDNNLIVAMECTNVVKGKKSEEENYTTIYECKTSGITADIFILSSKGEFIKNLYDLNAKIVTSSANDATVVFNDVISTTNNDVLLGGYYYSKKSIDVDKDGSTLGKKDFKVSSNYNSNGFLIKLDLNGNVNFSDCMYRKNSKVYAPSTINSVKELNNQKIIAGGNFYWENATTKNFYNKYLEENQIYINRIGNVDGFLFLENIDDNNSEIIETTNITVNNFKKKYKITTEVKSHIEADNIEVKGGKITGDYNQTIDGIEYKEEGIHYVETVKYGESVKREITITPDEGYKIEKIMINDEEYVDFTIDENGKVKLPQFSNVTNNIHIKVTFSKKIINFYELPITGSNNVLILDLIAVILICLGIIKLNICRKAISI